MKKIILVEDDEFALEQLRDIINWNEFDFECVDTFTNGISALAYISSMPVDAMITDIKMNDINGLELAEICKKNFSNIKIAVMSAYREFEYAHRALSCGVTNYIVKPLSYDNLIQCIKSLHDECPTSSNEMDAKEERLDTIMLAIAYMNAHLSENVSLTTVSNYVGFNPNYFSNYFKQYTGETFINFLTKLRVTKAKHLLKSTDIKISIICNMVGYKNPTHFYNVFAKYVDGQTPLQYRRNMNKGCDEYAFPFQKQI